jgi:hypothetical protein
MILAAFKSSKRFAEDCQKPLKIAKYFELLRWNREGLDKRKAPSVGGA